MNRNSSQSKTVKSALSLLNNEMSNRLAKTTTLIVISLFLLLSPTMIMAQAVSGVTGIVTDPSGAIIPGVEVKLTDTKTSREQTTTTNDQGVYVFNNVQPGAGYRLTFTGQGFQALVINEVQLGIGRTESHNAQLTAGQVSGTVTITSTTGDATLNTTDASIGNVIGERQLRELPIQIRDNPAALIGLQPGVIGNNVGTGNINRVGSVTGSRTDQGNITVDGIDANDVATGQAFVTIGNLPIDSVQEFRAITTNPNASEGRSSGGQIQLATKTGANDFHGSLREFFRTDKTAANTFFNNRNGIETPKLERNQFGGSLSGPLRKDKLFFFFDYEGRRDDSEIASSRIVPLQHYRDGGLGYINNTCGSIPIAQVRLDTNPQCITVLTAAQVRTLDPAGIGPNQALLAFINSRFPLPNDLSGGNGINTGLFRFNAPVTLSNNTYTPRIDWNITSNQRLFARATITRNDQTNATRVFLEDIDSQKLIDKSYQAVVGHTWVISPSFTNQATVGISRQRWDFPVPSSSSGTINFTFGNIQNPFASLSVQNRDVIVPTIRDDATWTIGSHTFQFGGQFKPINQKSVIVNDYDFATIGIGGLTSELNSTLRPANIRPNSTTATSNFDSDFTFLLGRLASLNTNFNYDKSGTVLPLGTGKTRNYVYNEYELYAQDNWKLRNDLTINLGVRWHFYPAPYEKNGFQTGNGVDFQELIDKRIANAAAGISGPTAEPFLSYNFIGKANNGRPLYEPDYNNFAPRLGFAYSPSFEGGVLGAIFGNRKTVIRGGASMVYDRPGGGITFIQDQSNYILDASAGSSFGNLNPRLALLRDPRFTSITSVPVQNVAPTITIPSTPNVSGGVPFGLETGQFNYAVSQNFEIPYSYTWNLGFQRELPGNLLVDVSYVGRKGRKLFAQADASQIMNFKDPTSGQLMLDAFNALQAQIAAGGAITAQPWFENQIGAAALTNYGARCNQFGLGANCTELLANFVPAIIEQGGTANALFGLAQNGLLPANVGLSSQFAANAFVTNLGSSDYNALLISLQKRFSKGFQFTANYTFSHATDNQSSVVNTVASGLIDDIQNVNASRGDSDFDIRHLFNANGIWELPFGRGRAFGKNMPKWVDAFVGGWTLSGIFTARSGLPVNASAGVFGINLLNSLPPVLIGDKSAFRVKVHDDGTAIQYFADPDAVQAALRYPKHGEVGNRNIFRSEGFFQLDTVLSKKFRMPWSESHLLTFRIESYNITNSNFFSPPNLNFGTASFGQITGSQSSPREFQFGLRYDF